MLMCVRFMLGGFVGVVCVMCIVFRDPWFVLCVCVVLCVSYFMDGVLCGFFCGLVFWEQYSF